MALPASADVVIVGGGAMGASTAWHLTQLGITDVLLLERDVLASGSTGKSAGGIRMQFADALNVEVMRRSVAAFEGFDARFGTEIDFEQPGYLILVTPEHAGRFDAALAVQHELGVPTERWSPEQIRARVPQVDTAGLAFATYNPREGYATPEAVVQGYAAAAAAAAAGARIEQSCTVTGVDVRAGQVTGVQTSKGPVRTGVVVCAAGTGSVEIGAALDVPLPVRGEPHRIHFSPNDWACPRTCRS